MTIPFICVFIAFALIYLYKLPLAVAMARSSDKGYDNKHPRQQQAALLGWGARANAAHNNAFEAFAPFAAAVLVAHLGGGDPRKASLLAIAFVVARVLYPILYIANADKGRSAIWFVGIFCTGGLFLLPCLH